MASFNDNGRGGSPKRRLDDPRRRRMSVLVMESLENRRLLTSSTSAVPTWHPTDTNLLDAQNGPMANLGPGTVKVYGEYLNYIAAGSKGAFTSSLSSKVLFVGTDVGLDVRGYGDFPTYEKALMSLGMIVTATTPSIGLVEGYVPISKLPQIAEEAQTIGGEPIYKASLFQQGVSPNQADVALNAAAARTKFNVNGAGQTIGVLSDSANQYNGGLAASVATGDLPSTVQVLQDGPAGSTDEGRAMLEQIYDIAPGAALDFATGTNGEAGFATNINALFSAGAKTIVDDIGYPDEPYYQDGIVQNAVNSVVNSGGTYVSSVGNQADSGYESQFRGVTATVGSLGSGTYMNFDPTGATQTTQLGINVYTQTGINFQFDQPYYTTSGVTSDLELDVFNAAGTLVVQANADNIAQQTPYQTTDINLPAGLPTGLYTVAIKLDSGPAPGHVVFYADGDGGFATDTKFGSAGGTFYPSTHGHNSGADTISVGAVPFWSTPGYVHTPTLDNNEPYSSFGPVLKEFNFDGSALATPTLLLKPDVSSTDANNTSFFIPGEALDTSIQEITANPPYPGDPATSFSDPVTPTNQSVPTLFNFTGTSSAAPNLAAVIALMKQSNPALTRNEILQNLETTTSSLNNVPAGTWSPQAGYGLVNAVAALSAVQTLKVLSIVPGSNSTTTTIPTFLTVTFNQPVNGSTLSAADLLIAPPNGATVAIGHPIGVDDPLFPTIVRFPITITPAGTLTANGLYKDAIAGPIVSESGQALSSDYFDQFTLNDTAGPRVVNTTFIGRVVSIQFSEALNPATVTPNNIFIFRDGGVNNPVLGASSIIVSQLPGATFTYNASTFTVTIDLTNVVQSSLPTDHYGLVVKTAVTDSINNPLNGAFSGVFPSGTTPATATGSVFYEDLGVLTLQAPKVSTLTLAPNSDSGITGDMNTDVSTPSLVGQVTSSFPGSVAGLLVYAEYNGISHTGVATGGLDLALGSNGRGFVGHYDVQTTTNALGQFTINYPAGVTPLPDGLNRVRVVIVGLPDTPPLPGISSVQDTSFRVDTTEPIPAPPATGGLVSSVPDGSNINSLTTLTLNVADPVNPQTIGSPFAVPATLSIPALNPITADNTSSYRLYRISGTTLVDESSFIASANFVSTSARVQTSDPYTGAVTLTFNPGLPEGSYRFLALSSANGTGLSDAAGNPFNGLAAGGGLNYVLSFNLQPTPTYITSYVAYTPDASTAGGYDTTGVRASYEIPISGVPARADAPPSLFSIDFSNSLNATTNYSKDVELVRSANSTTALPDGNFGDLGITNTSGYTIIAGTTVTLTNSIPGAVAGQYGFDNRLLISLPAGFTLPADYYRLYIPNSSTSPITDVFGNQLDGEFLGYQNSAGKYVDQLQTGQVRGSGNSELPDLTGDGIAGGAFMTGFAVVPNGNILYAEADAIYNPLIPSQTPDGSAARPYPVLAPEAVPNAINGGDLNSSVNAGTNFNASYDRSGDGSFEPSAFFAAQERLQATGGPVVIIAEASVPTRDPATGAIIQKPFVLQAPAPSGSSSDSAADDASAAVPALTTLVFDPGTILKMQNAALLVQNQGSALQILGGSNAAQTVIITSYKDSTVGGDTNGDPNSIPEPGDYGGIVFRNFSQAALPGETTARADLFPGQIPITGDTAEDDRLKGQFTNLNDPDSQADAISGADDIMSSISYLTERYAGGAVPQTIGTRYDGITLLNSRPAIVNSILSNDGGAGAQAGISLDVDSLREDDVAQGPLIRNDQFFNNGLNGIYIRADAGSGVAEATNAESYPTNPTTDGGAANYILNSPYQYLLTSKMAIGQRLDVESGAIVSSADRLYVDPGMLVKFETGSWLEIGQNEGFAEEQGQGTSASLVVGDPTYIKEYDQNNLVSPSTPGFKANSTQLAKVLFTSFNDNAATTFYTDPITQVTTTIVSALAALPAAALTAPPAKGDWGGIQLDAGSRDTINGAVFNYAGGFVNTSAGSNTLHAIEINRGDTPGAFLSITNNTIMNSVDTPIELSPNSLMATDPATPLNSGDPFIHGNLFVGNDFNGVGVTGGTTGFNDANLTVDSVWAGSDFTYFLRDTIVLAGGIPSVPSATVLQATPTPFVTLTLQSTLPGTVLADGSVVAAPGVPLVIKLLNVGSQPPAASDGAIPAASLASSFQEGAGFVVGIDNGIDPTTDSLVDPGAFSDIRIVGIGANQTTGQSRVPVEITSAYDDTVGTTVNGQTMDQLIPGNTTSPTAGDGGVIYFGANSLTSYNLLDPRSGSIIDNADIKYITRIEQQGGGIVYGFDLTGANALTHSYDTLFGLPQGAGVNFADQYNAPKSITVSNSNLSTFKDIGFYAHPGYGSLIIPVNYTSTAPVVRDTGYLGEPTHDYFVNDTFSNMPTAVEILSESGGDLDVSGPFVTPAEVVFLNDDFYKDAVGIHTIAPEATGTNFFSHVAILALDSIFDGSTIAAVMTDGQNYGGTQNEGENNVLRIIQGQLQYNDYFGNLVNVGGTDPAQNSQPIFTDPGFRNPAAGNFFLLPTSSVIDVARSEIGPTIFGDMLYPADTVNPANLSALPIRNEPVFTANGTLDQTKPAGDINFSGGLGYEGANGGPTGVPYYADIVTLPGRVFASNSTGVSQIPFPDQWVPVLQSSGLGTIGNAGSPATYAYEPIIGQRDQVGNLRVKDPNSPNIGYGSNPVYDLGAFEYIVQNPPIVEGVSATTATTGTSNIYGVGTISGVNSLPSSIQFLFNEELNPATISNMSVLLEASGGDGIFGNGNSPLDRTINLTGDLSFNNATDILTINTSGIFTSLAAANDEYRIILKGTGSSVLRDNSGLALDGLNLDSSGNQTALPSGKDDFPGSDFQVTFTIDTHAPTLVAGTFELDPASDTSGGLNITNNQKPTFDGTITDVFPPVNFLQGQSVHIDVSSQGNGVFDILDAGVGITDANGNFKVTLTKAIPDTPNKVGTNGIQEGPGSSLTLVRVRIVDQAGNSSNSITAPLSTYAAEGALTGLQEDTVAPKVAAFTPTANTTATANAKGQIVFTATFTKNLKNATLNAGSVLVYRSGGTGNFTTPVAVPLVAGSFTYSYSTVPATLGYETVTFAIAAAQPNDQYEVVLKGTGTAPITDLAGNPLNGGTDYTSGPVVLFTPSNAHLIYVAPIGSSTSTTATLGSRENPFTTIAAGLNAAFIGDDVLVLPGTYREDVTMKAGVRLLSADPTSTDTTFFPGSPYETLIYGVAQVGSTSNSGNNITTVYITGSTVGIPTEVSGFAIISPLIGDSNLGTIDSTDVAVRAINTNAAIDRNIIVNAGIGLYLSTAGSNAATSSVYDNLIVGNINGVGISDNGSTSSVQAPFLITNNTIADNTTGLFNVALVPNSTQAFVVNNIFFSNHDLTTKRTGTAIASNRTDSLAVGNNLFYQNGPTNAAVSNATGTFNGFNPALLSTTPDALGNILANPFFAMAEDPRPNGDSPSVFFTYSNFDLTSRSLAINAADNALAPPSDFLYRTPVAITGHGFPGTGPASIGAFDFGGKTGTSGGTGIPYTGTSTTTTTGSGGTGGTGGGGKVSAFSISTDSTVTDSSIGGGIALGTKQFSVLTTSLSNNGTVEASDTLGTSVTEPGPSYIDVNFSDSINASTVSPTDLVLSGTGLSSTNPAKATSLAWIDNHAIRFFLTGGYNNSGTVNVSLPQGSITDSNGASLVAFGDSFQVGPVPVAVTAPAAPVALVGSTTAVTPSSLVAAVLPVVQPVAAAAPVALLPATSPTSATHTVKLTAKEQKKEAAEAKALKAAEAKAAKALKAAEAKAAKAALKVKKAK